MSAPTPAAPIFSRPLQKHGSEIPKKVTTINAAEDEIRGSVTGFRPFAPEAGAKGAPRSLFLEAFRDLSVLAPELTRGIPSLLWQVKDRAHRLVVRHRQRARRLVGRLAIGGPSTENRSRCWNGSKDDGGI